MAVQERYEEGRTRLMPVGLVEADGETLVYPVDKGSGATTSLVEADGVVEVDADTAYLAADEAVTVQLFSPDVRPPTLLGVGEDDPALSRLLDRLERPRYLDVGSRQARRRLRDGVPDVAVVSGPSDREVDAVDLGGWTREWGLIVDDADVSGLADLVDGDYRFVNRGGDSGLRASLDAALDRLADDRGVDRRDLAADIDGYDLTVKGFESPARKVLGGTADAGLGLRATAAALDCGFVPLGTESVRVLAAPERADKPGVTDLERALEAGLDDAVADLPGFAADR
jgi:molybdate-binding protein